jgi:hypothetical protein
VKTFWGEEGSRDIDDGRFRKYALKRTQKSSKSKAKEDELVV